MSDVIPQMDSAQDMPYCIWHPVTAKEDTYRELAKRYPGLVYQVARACAVAGYTLLYHELDDLPDVHIAEEARECGNLEIYEAIMSQPVRYDIMNDYKWAVDLHSRRPANLNGDTAVLWMLNIKQAFRDATSKFQVYEDGAVFADNMFDSLGYEEQTTFNLCEDMQIDEQESSSETKRISATRSNLRLLHEPLPMDQPSVQKDVLILMAAYEGNVDRYARLRRPMFIPKELGCCIRGIYHNPLFAVWWSKQSGYRDLRIEKAINARFIMTCSTTYRQLARLQPSMLPQIVRACIHVGYQELFDELLPSVKPDRILLREAEEQTNPHFKQALIQHAEALGVDIRYSASGQGWKEHISASFQRSTTNVQKFIDGKDIAMSADGPYDMMQCDASTIELNACLPDAWKLSPDAEPLNCSLDYEEWPPLQ